jgi:hypothetical protein
MRARPGLVLEGQVQVRRLRFDHVVRYGTHITLQSGMPTIPRLPVMDTDSIAKTSSAFEEAHIYRHGTLNEEGVYHQSLLPACSKIEVLISKLSAKQAAAVHADAEQVVYSDEEEKKVKRKIDLLVLPLVFTAVVCEFTILLPPRLGS